MDLVLAASAGDTGGESGALIKPELGQSMSLDSLESVR